MDSISECLRMQEELNTKLNRIKAGKYMDNISECLKLQAELNEKIETILYDLKRDEESTKQIIEAKKEESLDDIFYKLRVQITRISDINNRESLDLDLEIQSLRNMANRLRNAMLDLDNKTSEAQVKKVAVKRVQIEKPDVQVKQSDKTETRIEVAEPIVNTQINEQPHIEHEVEPVKEQEKAGFNIGVGALNILGILLVLVSLATFGRYVYVNYLSATLKGIILFLIPLFILVFSELYLSSKSLKFSRGITALGISGLYIAVIMNYLVLHTIPGMAALIVTTLITSSAIYLSYRNESHIIRIITLVGAYIALMPLDKLSEGSSYTLVAMLAIIHTLNIGLPLNDMKNKVLDISFEFYTAVLALISTVVLGINMTTIPKIVFLLAVAMIYSVQYIIISKHKDSVINGMVILSYFLIYPLYTLLLGYELKLWYLPVIAYSLLGGAILSSIKDKARWVGYTGIIIPILVLIIKLDIDYRSTCIGLIIITIAIMTCVTLKLFITTKNTFVAVTLWILSFISCGSFLYNIRSGWDLAYLVAGALTMYICSEYKDRSLMVLFRYAYVSAVAYWIISLIVVSSPLYHYRAFIVLLIYTIYVVILNNVKMLKYEGIESVNFVSLLIVSVIAITIGFDNSTYFYLTTGLVIVILISMMTPKYIGDMVKNLDKPTISTLLATYIVIRLGYIVDVGDEFRQLVISVSLMLTALGSVFIGFKIDAVIMRKYGLVLSLLVCAKVMLVDFNSYSFIIKTAIFMIVGIIALIISYTFSRLEKEYKNKQ